MPSPHDARRRLATCLLLLLATCLTTLLLPPGVGAQDVFVRATTGTYRGDVVTPYGGDRVHRFLGIRYAKSPADEERFKVAEPVDTGSSENIDATSRGSSCWQTNNDRVFDSGLSSSSFSEDCLFLNIWAPRESNNVQPTIVWIHDGAFSRGPLHSGSIYEEIYQAAEMAAFNQVVVVTVAYRLGVLGFLSTGDDAATGNWGLRDQLEALSWIRANIRAFGGDPSNVVLVGGTSVSLHMMSPLSR
ncbi:PREDICTED: cholinesterase-like, partial [Priapulus caudatus]|uniref:Cholinesterase-like n=1 Tax=Priapulus caudatus TaxID=37621 RepID=A0ABM1F624_PRICU